jgi:hypothetical protein
MRRLPKEQIKAMKRHRTKILFAISAVVFVSALLLETDKGQIMLRGTVPPNATHFERDDIYMGAGLAPVVYGGILALVFFVAGIVSWAFSRHRTPNAH